MFKRLRVIRRGRKTLHFFRYGRTTSKHCVYTRGHFRDPQKYTERGGSVKTFSETVAEPLDFFETCRVLDHIQKKAKTHLLTSHDVEKALGLLGYYQPRAVRVEVTVYGGYSGPKQIFPCICSRLRLSFHEGRHYSIVSRSEAPESPYYHGPRYSVSLTSPRFNELRPLSQFVGPVKDPRDPAGDTFIINSLILS
jgi:hypothetical protein